MQTRILATLAGGLLGFVLANQINTNLALGLTPTAAFIGCSFAGLAIGYAASILIDVFAGGSPTSGADSQK